MSGGAEQRPEEAAAPAPANDLRSWVAEKRRQGVPWAHIAKQCGRPEAGLRALFEGVTG